MSDLNAMEVLALASLTIKDLAKGFKGEVVIEADACLGLADEKDVESHKRALEEIHQGQRDMAALGWVRAPEFLIERMWVPHHNVIRAAWFKDDHEKKETNWITCSITSRFGLRAVFTSKTDGSARIIKGRELRELLAKGLGIDLPEED